MVTKGDFKIGQKVWHTSRHIRHAVLTEGVVTTVGHKYITVDGRYRFYKDTLQSETNYQAQLYLDKQSFYDDLDLKGNLLRLRDSFNFSSDVTLEQTRKILNILDKD